MKDKVQKIKDWISKTQDGLMDANGNFEYPEHEGAYHILCDLDTFIDSLQEEPKFKTGNKVIYLNEEYEIADITDHYILHRVRTAIDGRISVLHLEFDKEELMELVEEPVSEDLENAAIKYAQDKYMPVQTSQAFKAGAEWGKNQAEIQIKAQSMALAHGCPKESVNEDLEKIVEEIAEPTILNAYGTKELARRLRNTICGTSVSEDLNEAVTRIIKETGNICPITCGEIDYCNKKHLDYRGLIEKGLAIEAPKDMYNIK